MTKEVAADLTLMNLPKNVSKMQLKKQYHKFAKMYHPDVVFGQYTEEQRTKLDARQVKKIEEKFNKISEAHERLTAWISERDQSLDHKLRHGQVQGVEVDDEDGTVTYTLGALKIRGKTKELNKNELLLQMVEEDLTLKEPKNLLRWLYMFWAGVGIYCCLYSQHDGENNFSRWCKELL